jgi:2-polyprenyl-6-methoxyphenol hydroxylase-like FAD-dependent oxidoreductase
MIHHDPVGRLPSDRVVMPLGDTAMALDPITAQGANLGSKQVRHVVAAIAADPEATFGPTRVLARERPLKQRLGARALWRAAVRGACIALISMRGRP